MSTILGLDLGKFKSLGCLYDPATPEARSTTIRTAPHDLRKLMEDERPALVVFETRTVADRVADSCDGPKLHDLVADSMHGDLL